jgi:hypothetical protein
LFYAATPKSGFSKNEKKFQLMTLLLDIASEMSFFEGPASKHIMFTMGEDFSYQVGRGLNYLCNHEKFNFSVDFLKVKIPIHLISDFPTFPIS